MSPLSSTVMSSDNKSKYPDICETITLLTKLSSSDEPIGNYFDLMRKYMQQEDIHKIAILLKKMES